MSMSMPDMSMSMPNKECVKDGDTFTVSMYKEGSDEQYDIEDLALKWCCSGTLNGKACTSSIEMDENGISLPEGSGEGKCGVPDDDVMLPLILNRLLGCCICWKCSVSSCYRWSWSHDAHLE